MNDVAKALDEGTLLEDPFLRQRRAERIHQLKKQASAAGSHRLVGVAGIKGQRGQLPEVGREKLWLTIIIADPAKNNSSKNNSPPLFNHLTILIL